MNLSVYVTDFEEMVEAFTCLYILCACKHMYVTECEDVVEIK